MILPQTGMPPMEGRYVVFVRCQCNQVREWVEPIIAAYTPGKWHVPEGRGVYGWIGPLPVLKVSDFAPDEKSWDEVFSDIRKTEHGTYVADAPKVYDL